MKVILEGSTQKVVFTLIDILDGVVGNVFQQVNIKHLESPSSQLGLGVHFLYIVESLSPPCGHYILESLNNCSFVLKQLRSCPFTGNFSSMTFIGLRQLCSVSPIQGQ